MSTSEHIPAFSYIAEPALVAAVLTAGCLINRRTTSQLRQLNQTPQSALPPRPSKMVFFRWEVPVPDTSEFSRRWISRFLARFPFLMEVWYWLLTYWVYQLARAAQAVTMGDNTREISQDHAIKLLSVEKFLHVDMELGLQHWVMKSQSLLVFFNKTYAMVHIPATTAYFAYSYWAFSPSVFQRVRRTLVLCNCLAFIIFTTWPCMPPRLLPEEYGYVDTVHSGKAASIWTTNKFQNQLAAFPSLHFGYSWTIGVALYTYSPHRAVRYVALLYPVLILLVIMATANHYFLDAVGGGLVTVLAYKFNNFLLNLRAIEEWGFWICGVEKPMEKDDFDRVISSSYQPEVMKSHRHGSISKVMIA